MNNSVRQWLDNRVTLLTGKSTEELREIGEEINSRAFYVAKLTSAAAANPLREISDAFVRGDLDMTEAQDRIHDLFSGSPDEIARQLAAHNRSRQVLTNQRQLARGIAEWQSWQEDKADFPYVIYHASNDQLTRPSHRALDGRVFHVDDPFLRTHMPGHWDYNCRCTGEPVTEKRGLREAAKNGGIQPPGEASFEAESGYMFDPANAFKPDASELKDKTGIVRSMEQSVRSGQVGKIGMIVASPKQAYSRADLSRLDEMTNAMRQLQSAAQVSADKAGWDPKKNPGYQAEEKFFKAANPDDMAELPGSIRTAWGGKAVQVGDVTVAACRDTGIGEANVPVVLDLGGRDDGLIHCWQHHKEVFIDPDEGARILRSTLGNQHSQVSVTFENQGNHFRKVVQFYDPRTKSYCVMRYDDKNHVFRLMSWHRAPASYGENQLEIRGKQQKIVNPDGTVTVVNDRTRRMDHWREQHERKKK